MNATSQFRPTVSALSASHLAQACTWLKPDTWLKRSRATARARHTLTQLDARTLRDIGITRRQLAVLTVTSEGR